MNIKEILKDVEVTEEQAKAIVEFVDEVATAKAAAISEEFEKYKAKTKKAFAAYSEDVDARVKRIEDKASRAFAIFEADSRKAFEIGVKKTKAESAENMVTALQELYVEAKEKAKAELLASPEFAVVENLKTQIASATDERTKALVEEVETLRRKERAALEQIELTERQKTIDSLCEDIPKKFQKNVREFISGAKTNDEVLERFKAISHVIIAEETDPEVPAEPADGEDGKPTPVSESMAPEGHASADSAKPRFARKNARIDDASAKNKEVGAMTPVFESKTAVVETVEGGTKERFSRGFSEFERKLLNSYVFPKTKSGTITGGTK